MASWWKEKDFQQNLLSFICRDRNFLKRCGSMLKPKDFKPGRDESDERWIVATLSLEYYQKYKEPISGMLRTEVRDFCDKNNVDSKRKKALIKLVDTINSGEKLVAVEAMEDRVIEYLRAKKQKDALEDLISKHEDGTLTTETFTEICRTVTEWQGKSKRDITSFLDDDSMEQRVTRRKVSQKKRPPLFLPGFDTKSHSIARGELGVILAPYKKGKSLFLAHIADAYAKQNLKVLYITLEDAKDEVENRMDAATAYMPINRLNELPNKFRKRFRKFSKRIQGQIRIVDATEEAISVAEIEELWERLRDQGWTADAVIIDYDDEIRPPKAHKGESARRQEFGDIYRELRRFAARRQLYVWTAAQTKRLPESTKIISGDKVAEDISKLRKAFLVLGLGQGEKHEDARYIYVAAAKNTRQHYGFEIMANPSYGLLYDAERTAEAEKYKPKKKKRKIE